MSVTLSSFPRSHNSEPTEIASRDGMAENRWVKVCRGDETLLDKGPPKANFRSPVSLDNTVSSLTIHSVYFNRISENGHKGVRGRTMLMIP